MCKEPREHLRPTQFFVHTHNLVAGLLMVLQMRSSGFKAEFRPFGQDLARILAHNETDDEPDISKRSGRPGTESSGASGPSLLRRSATAAREPQPMERQAEPRGVRAPQSENCQ